MDLNIVVDSSGNERFFAVQRQAGRLPHLRYQSTTGASASEADSGLTIRKKPLKWADDHVLWANAEFVLGVGTAGACRLVAHGHETIDAREYLRDLWLSQNNNLRTNGDLRVSRLIKIKSAFGLSNSDLARVCRISRTQLYKWLGANEETQLNGVNWERLADLARLAEDWTLLSKRPARQLLNEQLENGQTLLAMLSAQQLNHQLVRQTMQRLARLLENAPKRRDEMLRQQGIKPTMRPGQLDWDE